MLSTLRSTTRCTSRQISRTKNGIRTIVTSFNSRNQNILTPATARNFCSHEFKAETKKLLDIVAKSLYTDPEVFVRELISNASDSLEKLRFSVAAGDALVSGHSFNTEGHNITLSVDPNLKTFTISDNGIGMTKNELIENLGTIAKSGSKDYETDAVIGQFGVGFYSTFVVADHVTVYSRHSIVDDGSKGHVWKSSGLGTFDVSEYDGKVPLPCGTSIVCHLKEDHLAFSNANSVRDIATKFSNFVDFPIRFKKGSEQIVKEKQALLDEEKRTFEESVAEGEKDGKDAEGEKEGKVAEGETNVDEKAKIFSKSLDDFTVSDFDELNASSEALWLKSNPTEAERAAFFKFLNGNSYGEALYSFVYHTDAPLSIKSIFYVPEEAPNRMFSSANSMQVGVSLHSKRVLVAKHADKIMPQWLHWVKGVVDCDDLPLNVSRENMQDSALTTKLSHAIVRRFLKFLSDSAKKDAATYDKFFSKYSFYLKAGLLDDSQNNNGNHKEPLSKLLKFNVTNVPEKEGGIKNGDLVSFDEYIGLLKELKGEDVVKKCGKILYLHVNGGDLKSAENSPFMEQFTKGNLPVLVMTDDVDEFVVSYLSDFGGYKISSIDGENLDVGELLGHMDRDRSARTLSSDDLKFLEGKFKEVIGMRVSSVVFTDRLSDSPAIVTSQMNPHMRKMMKNMMANSGGGGGGAFDDDLMPMTLQLNPSHQIVTGIFDVYKNTDAKSTVADSLAILLFENAAISAGLVDDSRKLLPKLQRVLSSCVERELGFISGIEGGADDSTEKSDIPSGASVVEEVGGSSSKVEDVEAKVEDTKIDESSKKTVKESA